MSKGKAELCHKWLRLMEPLSKRGRKIQLEEWLTANRAFDKELASFEFVQAHKRIKGYLKRLSGKVAGSTVTM